MNTTIDPAVATDYLQKRFLTKYPMMADLIRSFNHKLLLLTIQGRPEEDDYPFEFDDLHSELTWDIHYQYDETLDPDLSIEQRFRSHRQLEKDMLDADLEATEDWWFNQEYDYPPEDDEDFWDRVHNDPTDPLYQYKYKSVSLEELGL